MFNRNFSKQLSFCVFSATSIGFLQNSYGFTANNQGLVTKKELPQVSTVCKDSMAENLKLAEEQEKIVGTKLQKADQSTIPEEVASTYDEELGRLLQGNTSSKDSMAENLKIAEEQEKYVGTEPQKEKIDKNLKMADDDDEELENSQHNSIDREYSLEQSFIKRINDKYFEGFFGKIYLALKLPSVLAAYTELKAMELLRINKWPKILGFIAFVFTRCIVSATVYAAVFSCEILVLLCLVFGVKYLVQKSKEGISKLIGANKMKTSNDNTDPSENNLNSSQCDTP